MYPFFYVTNVHSTSHTIIYIQCPGISVQRLLGNTEEANQHLSMYQAELLNDVAIESRIHNKEGYALSCINMIQYVVKVLSCVSMQRVVQPDLALALQSPPRTARN